MKHIIDRVAYFCDTRERRILGYDLDECIHLKFPPCRLNVHFEKVHFRIEKDPYSSGQLFVTSHPGSRNEGLFIKRMIFPDKFEDAYCINDIRYTHYYDYLTGQFTIWHGYKTGECIHDVNPSHREPTVVS
jgi:hypothetical protein